MSYRLWIKGSEFPICPTCKHQPDRLDASVADGITRNVSPIVNACLNAGGATKAKCEGFSGASADYAWCRLHGWTGAELLPIAVGALAFSQAPEQQEMLSNLNPYNGWGTLADVVACLGTLVEACRSHPAGTFMVEG